MTYVIHFTSMERKGRAPTWHAAVTSAMRTIDNCLMGRLLWQLLGNFAVQSTAISKDCVKPSKDLGLMHVRINLQQRSPVGTLHCKLAGALTC